MLLELLLVQEATGFLLGLIVRNLVISILVPVFYNNKQDAIYQSNT